MDRLSGDYNRGYTRGIMDIKEVFEYIQHDLKYHNKRLTLNLVNNPRLKSRVSGLLIINEPHYDI